MTWQEEVREAVARAICEEIDHLPFGELDEPHRMQARESYLADADLILDALAPVVVAEVARAEARGKVAALREAAVAWSDWEALEAPETWLRDRADAIEAEAGER